MFLQHSDACQHLTANPVRQAVKPGPHRERFILFGKNSIVQEGEALALTISGLSHLIKPQSAKP
jgi:hypothetical protein